MKTTLFGSTVLLLLLTACATTSPPEPGRAEVSAERHIQQRLEIANTMRYQKRIDPIAHEVLRGGLRFCDDEITYATGLRIANRASFPKDLRDAASAELGLGSELEVLWVTPGTPGAKAGIEAGDKILAINGRKMPTGQDGLEALDEALAKAARKKRPLKITIQRQGESREIGLDTEPACHYPVIALLDATPNAYANGSIIAIHSGLINMLANDRDIAIVMAHELAHNIKNHPTKGIFTGLLGILVAVTLDDEEAGQVVSAQFSPPLEAEADYVGLYICANAGIDINGAENVWRRFAAEFSGAKEKSLLDTHPPTPERYVALRKTVGEIEEKRRRGEALVPNGARD